MKFQEVKNNLNLLDVATHLGSSLTKQSGSNTYHGTCPTGHASLSGKSFHVDVNKGLCHCFNCGIGGDVISLVEEVKKISKWDSLKWLVKDFSLNIKLGEQEYYPKPTPEEIQERKEMISRSMLFEKIYESGKKLLYEADGKEALKYLTDVRGYDAQVLKNTEWFYLPEENEVKKQLISEYPEMKDAINSLKLQGHFGDNFRLAFPYRNKDGVITGFLKRATEKSGISVTTYDNKLHSDVRWDSTPKLSKSDLFGLDKVVGGEDTLIIVEGYPDAIYLQALGIKNIVAVGQGLLSEKHLSAMISKKIKSVIISFDNDGVGAKNTEKAVKLLLKDSNVTPYVIDPADYGSHKDPDEYFKANGFESLKKVFDEKLKFGAEWIVSMLTKDIATVNEIKLAELKENVLDVLALVGDKNKLESIRLANPKLFPETKVGFAKLVKSKTIEDSLSKLRQMISQDIVPFIDTNTNSRCYYNSIDDSLSMNVDERILEEIMVDYNLEKPSRYPTFKIKFNPQDLGERFNIEKKTFNLFTPTNYMFQSKSDDELDLETVCPTTFQLIKNLIPIEKERMHFINWLSYIFSTRSKIDVSWVFRGAQGSGKNLFFDHIIKPLFGEKQTIVVDDDRLKSDFNGYMMNKLFVAFNEVANDDASSKRSVKSKIKAIVSDKKAIINEKNVKTYEIENFANIVFFSNEAIPILIEGGDRRFNVIETGGKLKNISSFAANPTVFIKSLKDELFSFAQFLLNYKNSDMLAGEVIENEAKASIQELSMNRFELFASKLKIGDWDWFDENYPSNYLSRNGLITEEELKSKEVLKMTILNTFNIINSGNCVSSTKLTQQLNLLGITTKRRRVNNADSHYYTWQKVK